MQYIYATRGGVLAFLLSLLAVYFIQGPGPSEEVRVILTVSIFLFSILAGFFITRSNNRYNKVRETVADEDAYFLALYHTAKLYGKRFSQKMADLIDQYHILAFDHYIYDYYKHNAYVFEKFYSLLESMKKYKGESSFAEMINMLTHVERSRNQSSVLSQERITRGQWNVLIILVGIIIFCIFYLETGEWYIKLLTSLLTTVLITILLILRDLENLRIHGDLLFAEEGQQLLEQIGKLRYYNHVTLREGSFIPASVSKYRLGLHKPGEKMMIKVVDRH